MNKPFQHQEVLARVKTDLTIKKQAEKLKQSEANLNTIVTHLYDGILIIDQDGVVKFANPAAARMFNQPLEAILNHTLGKPILADEIAELDIIRANGQVGVAEITVSET
ncbi:MAG: PAS domain-containing protein [Microcoleaceae cyanobacterium MO_207.B10]|nr:PAS domain-containing protein [Microcoleaceae cyanobacterium MO_207.B10]